MSKFQELLQQEITRKEFIRYIGLAFLGVVGVTALLQNLTNTLGEKPQQAKAVTGYGKNTYGR